MQLNRNRHTDGLVFWLALLSLATVALIAMTWIALGADNDAACLSKSEARTKYPKDIIYWHGAQHCWDNVKPGGRKPRTPQPQSRAARPTVKIVRWNELNEIDLAADRDTFFEADPVPVWRLAPIPFPVMDVDSFAPWSSRIAPALR